MSKIEAFTAAVLIGFLAWTGPAFTQDVPNVDEIVRRTNHAAYYQGQDGRARATMTITDAQGRTRVKEFSILRQDLGNEDADQNFYVYFHKPADERGVVFMVHKHIGKDDDRWIYLPALDVQKRIAATDKRTSFVGSHFFYEDVSGRGLDDDEHELVEVTKSYYVLKNTPKDSRLVEFDSYTMWVHRATFIPVEVKYEKNGEVYRAAKVLGVKDVQGFKTVTKSEMTDLQTGGKTVMEYSTVEYDLGLESEIFTERYLRTAPMKYLE